jgi:uncharacterized protein
MIRPEPHVQKDPQIEITRHTLALQGLPAELHGATIVQISDLHRGCGNTDALIESAIGHANVLDPDFIFLTGDFINSRTRDILPVVKMVSGLRAKRGIYAVLGNHDHRGDTALLISALEAAGIIVLVNRAIRTQEGLWLAGVDDFREGKPDLKAALRNIPPGAPAILLSHEPKAIDMVPPDQPLVILSGHTHGGQLNFRFFPAALICRLHLHTGYVHGWYERGKVRLYVNRGIGVTGHGPMARRINCPSEITQFTLTPL